MVHAHVKTIRRTVLQSICKITCESFEINLNKPNFFFVKFEKNTFLNVLMCNVYIIHMCTYFFIVRFFRLIEILCCRSHAQRKTKWPLYFYFRAYAHHQQQQQQKTCLVAVLKIAARLARFAVMLFLLYSLSHSTAHTFHPSRYIYVFVWIIFHILWFLIFFDANSYLIYVCFDGRATTTAEFIKNIFLSKNREHNRFFFFYFFIILSANLALKSSCCKRCWKNI